MNNVSSPQTASKIKCTSQYFSLIFSGLKAYSKDDMVLSAVDHYIVKCSIQWKGDRRRKHSCTAWPEEPLELGAEWKEPNAGGGAVTAARSGAQTRGRPGLRGRRSGGGAQTCRNMLSQSTQSSSRLYRKARRNKMVIKAVISEARGRAELKKRHETELSTIVKKWK